MTSTAKVLSSFNPAHSVVPALRAVPTPPSAPRTTRWGGLALLRESFGGALLLVATLALWTATWAAVAGPLAPAPQPGQTAAAESVAVP